MWIVSSLQTSSDSILFPLTDYSDVTADSEKECNGWWYEDFRELLGDLIPDKKEYLSIYGRLLVNSFALRVDNKGEEENIGTGTMILSSANSFLMLLQHCSEHVPHSTIVADQMQQLFFLVGDFKSNQ